MRTRTELEDRVVAGGTITVMDYELVCPGSGDKEIVALATDSCIVARAADHLITFGRAIGREEHAGDHHCVGSVACDHGAIADAMHRDVTSAAEQPVAFPVAHSLAKVASPDIVGTCSGVYNITPAAADGHVVTAAEGYRIIPFAADDRVVAFSRVDDVAVIISDYDIRLVCAIDNALGRERVQVDIRQRVCVDVSCLMVRIQGRPHCV
jgi:hypothetical protein